MFPYPKQVFVYLAGVVTIFLIGLTLIFGGRVVNPPAPPTSAPTILSSQCLQSGGQILSATSVYHCPSDSLFLGNVTDAATPSICCLK